jgi:hypothetical protein
MRRYVSNTPREWHICENKNSLPLGGDWLTLCNGLCYWPRDDVKTMLVRPPEDQMCKRCLREESEKGKK